jgi:acyl carrier protein
MVGLRGAGLIGNLAGGDRPIDHPRHLLPAVGSGPLHPPPAPQEIFVPDSNGDEPLDRPAVFDIVRGNLADILEIDGTTITEGQSFADDLSADSLALIELVEALEEEFSERSIDFRIEDEDLVGLKTVRDAVDYVWDRVQGSV